MLIKPNTTTETHIKHDDKRGDAYGNGSDDEDVRDVDHQYYDEDDIYVCS